MRTKNIKKVNFNLILMFAIPLMIIGITYSMYIENHNKRIIYEAKQFYFESDLLKDSTNPVSYKYIEGEDTISINLKNNIDDYRYSEVGITYVVSIKDSNGNSVYNKNGDIVKNIEGTIAKNNIQSKTINFDNLKSGTYVITAQATKPYEKTLQGTFVLTEANNNITYSVSDVASSPIVQLTITSKNYSGNIKLTWPNGVAPDSTDSIFSTVNSGTSSSNITTIIKANSEYTVQFFKKNPNTQFTKNDFSVERNS